MSRRRTKKQKDVVDVVESEESAVALEEDALEEDAEETLPVPTIEEISERMGRPLPPEGAETVLEIVDGPAMNAAESDSEEDADESSDSETTEDEAQAAEGEATGEEAEPKGLSPAQSAILERVVAQVRPGRRQPELEICAQLFSSHKPLSAEELAVNLGLGVGEVERSLARLDQTLNDSPFGVFRRTVAAKTGRRRPTTGYVLDLKATFRRNVPTVGRPVLSSGLTETLALIALNQPISQSRLVRERGTSVYDHVKELLARDWVMKQKAGRSYELRTTASFAAEFGLENEPDLIKRALARAAGVEGAADLVASERVAFSGAVNAEALSAEAQAVAPTPEEMAARAAAEEERKDALEAWLLRGGEPEQPILPVNQLGQASAQRAPSEGFVPLPKEDCVVSGGEAPRANVSIRATAPQTAAPYEAGEGVISGGAPPTANRIAGALAEAERDEDLSQTRPATFRLPEDRMQNEEPTTETNADESGVASNSSSKSGSRVAHLLNLIDDDATDDDW